jgi:hypothetical protein
VPMKRAASPPVPSFPRKRESTLVARIGTGWRGSRQGDFPAKACREGASLCTCNSANTPLMPVTY